MNKQRRNKLVNIGLRLENIKTELEHLLIEEEYYYDNIPENLQYSLRAEIAEEAIDNMQNATSNLNEILDLIDEVIENIDDSIV